MNNFQNNLAPEFTSCYGIIDKMDKLHGQLMRNRILVETLGHPNIEENRTLIRLNHGVKLSKL